MGQNGCLINPKWPPKWHQSRLERLWEVRGGLENYFENDYNSNTYYTTWLQCHFTFLRVFRVLSHILHKPNITWPGAQVKCRPVTWDLQVTAQIWSRHWKAEKICNIFIDINFSVVTLLLHGTLKNAIKNCIDLAIQSQQLYPILGCFLMYTF